MSSLISSVSPPWLHLHRPSELRPSSSSAFPSSLKPILPRLRMSLRPSNNLVALAHKHSEVSPYFDIELQVRDYELDQYGVVNNSVYANYCQHGRQEFINSLGTINCLDFAQNGDALAFSDLSVKFIAPLRSGDKFIMKVGLLGLSAARVNMHNLIFKLPNLEPILEAKATEILLNKNYRPIRIPAELRAKFSKFVRDGESI